MKTQISIPIKTEQFLELAEFLRNNNDLRDPVFVVSEAIDYWIQNASWKPELLAQSDARGYQWKNLFLPDGTQVRMPYKGVYYYARVEGDQIIYEGKPISPGSLANTVASSSRNAWRDLWIKRPEDKEWTLANDCRRDTQIETDKLLAGLDAIGDSPASSKTRLDSISGGRTT
jgi:hypothetical protein